MEIMTKPYNLEIDKNNFFLFPSPFIWWKKIKSHEKIKEKYLPLILDDIKSNGKQYYENNTWDCNVTSSFFNLKNNQNIFDEKFFNKVIWEPIDEMIEELSPIIQLQNPVFSNISQIWYNFYEKNNWQEIHNHIDFTCIPDSDHSYFVSSFSGIYLLKLKSKNDTCFVNSGTSMNCFTINSMQTLNTSNLTEGHVIIFPSELMHYVTPNLSKDRISVSFNIISKY